MAGGGSRIWVNGRRQLEGGADGAVTQLSEDFTCLRLHGLVYACTCIQSPYICATNCVKATTFCATGCFKGPDDGRQADFGAYFHLGTTPSHRAGVIGFNLTAAASGNTMCVPVTHSGENENMC